MKNYALVIGALTASRAVSSTIAATDLFSNISFANNSKTALQCLSRLQVDAVCLALSGPLDEFAELVEQLQGEEALSNIPILLFAPGPNIQELRISALELGASDCLAIDIGPREAGIQIEWHLKTKRRIDKLLQVKQTLARQAITDHLTGLYNRTYFDAILEQNIALHKRTNRPFSILFADLDHFKRINDQFGHPAGDRVLRQVACSLRKASRLSDVVCRYGGEEFAIILPECTADQAVAVADRIHLNLKSQQGRPVTTSIGIRSSENLWIDGERMIEEADRALYRAKALGRNRTEVFHDNALATTPFFSPQKEDGHIFVSELLIQPHPVPFAKVGCIG